MAAATVHSFETESTLTTFEVKTLTQEVVEERVEEVAPIPEMRNKAPKINAVEEAIRRHGGDRGCAASLGSGGLVVILLFCVVVVILGFLAWRNRRRISETFEASSSSASGKIRRRFSMRFSRKSRFENPNYFAPPVETATLVKEVERRDLNFMEKIGKGNFGDVYKAEWMDEKMDMVVVAVKALRPGCMTPEKFLVEASVMRGLVDDNVVRLLGVLTTEEPYLIVTEFMDGGDLLTYLLSHNLTEVTLPSADLNSFSIQICRGMRYLESQNFVHRDLAARNILINGRREAKVADFGLTKSLNDSQDYYTSKPGAKFPVKWSAPEAVLLNKFSSKSDVWSFGVTLTEIFTMGSVPYPGSTNSEVIEMLQQRRLMRKPLRISQDVWDNIILKCFQYSALLRPSFVELSDILGMNLIDRDVRSVY